MANHVISYADLSYINSALRAISSDVSEINSEISLLKLSHQSIQAELTILASKFYQFLKEDAKHKALQLAETRQGNLKQDLHIKYGYYAEVRRLATGILQGVDAGIVSDGAIRMATEEMMLKAPGYWLAPALVTIASWIRNDKSTCEKALKEALRRDDYRTSLFLMLIMRRLKRMQASTKWLERCFMHQDPFNLEREFIIILEAVTMGLFLPSARQIMMSHIKNWLEIISQKENFIEEQKLQWVNFFASKAPIKENEYVLLEKFSTNWNELENSLKEARTHEVLSNYFKDIINPSRDFSKNVVEQLDEILNLLVTNFDDEELPLQKEVRLNQLIIQMEGDKAAAQAVMDAEKNIYKEKVNFLQLLANATFNPDISGANKVTQALAVSICLPWIIPAYETFTAQCRNKIPATVELDIDGFKATTIDGSNQNELFEKHDAYFQQILLKETEKIPQNTAGYLMALFFILISIFIFYNYSSLYFFSAVILIFGIGFFIYLLNKYNKAKKAVNQRINERKEKSSIILNGCITEIVDYRKELTLEDAKSEKLSELLASIVPENFTGISRETARNII
ncbi:hypothetical protein [Hydrotalea sandarakina]|jgi:hypothetical protein|uniref:Uncharacterized protein n=1 Tax=Hydrotalea sandarakina TaxID=1004304 RepID=A0A2W7SB36_9BACT|nr:hypothetical protein [Hydrotalea sandarakina]PZX60055.1 hypothetical protein LX80_02622 [Hydrotalea sandarakina]